MADREGIGVLLYGYTEAEAREIGAFLEALTGRTAAVFGGSGLEEKTVTEVIEGEECENFGQRDVQMLMFLGFDDRGIEAALSAFPGHVPRPIFCGLTENNMGWPISRLLEHLLEEKMYWTKQKLQKS